MLQPHLRLCIVVVALVFNICAASCLQHARRNEQVNPSEINVAAAANLTDAFAELGNRFTAQTGIRVVYSFGATADLAKQIENGAPFDVFAAADVEHVDELRHEGLVVAATQSVFARGQLVIWTPPGARATIERIEDLRRKDVERIALARPDVAPYGRAALEAFGALDLWPELEAKVIYGQNVAQVKQYAATGNADVALIPLSLVKPNEGRFIIVDERLHKPLDQALAVIKDSRKQEAARRFREFVLSDEGQMLLERYGYHRPPATP